MDGGPTFAPASVDEWRRWLEDNHQSVPAVWLILYNQGSGTPTVGMGELVEHALCFGWIDSKAVKRDGESRYQRFSPRNPKSTWSRLNRERVERLTAAGLMRPPGQAIVDLARATGTWDVLGEAQDGVLPEDVQALFDDDAVAWANFQSFPPSSKRLILEWIAAAKRPDTRARRVAETVALAHDNRRANQPR